MFITGVSDPSACLQLQSAVTIIFLTLRSVAEVLLWHWAVEHLAEERELLVFWHIKTGEVRFFDF